MRLNRALTLAHELRQSARRLGAGVYEYWSKLGFLWQALDTYYRHLSNSYRVAMDLEKLYYAEGGFLVTIPKATQRSLTDCTTIVPGLPNRVPR